MLIILSTLLASLVGAVSGAYLTHNVSEKASAKKNLLRQADITNTLISYAFSEINNFLSLKKQYVYPLYYEYKLAHYRFKIFQRGIIEAEQFKIKFDFQQFESGGSNVETILRISNDVDQLDPKCISAINALMRADRTLSSIMKQRKEFISNNFVDKKYNDDLDAVKLYFGCYNDGRKISAEFLNLTDALYETVDDAIFFSNLLSNLLISHRDSIQDVLIRMHGYAHKNNPTISLEKSKNLLPEKENYADWEAGFEYVGRHKSNKAKPWWAMERPIEQEK